jgi:hypothetical protein
MARQHLASTYRAKIIGFSRHLQGSAAVERLTSRSIPAPANCVNGNPYRQFVSLSLRKRTLGRRSSQARKAHESVDFADVCVLENLASGFRRSNHGLENAFFSATFVPKPGSPAL